MGESARKSTVEDVLRSYRAGSTELYFIGTFNKGVTVLSQQNRALNLVWALVESEKISCLRESGSASGGPAQSIAVIGGGFAGLTFAAGLFAKRANAKVTIFEQRDTLLPLQQGSDSRWLHPRIYDWPSPGSQANTAMLPVLNWTAARASDVVVQVLKEWKNTVEEVETRGLPATLYCNSRHLHVHQCGSPGALRIEWVGEQRDARDGTTLQNSSVAAAGRMENFDLVVLAIGFGPERDAALSYWRNETLAQPSLGPARATYLVSGQGDGAMIDLLRLRISQFRQDRILSELFDGAPSLLARFSELYSRYASGSSESGMFDALEGLQQTNESEFEEVRQRLARRLRRDTDVVLGLKVKTFSQLFDPGRVRISFQNRLLVYLLYKCGGFYPSRDQSEDLRRQHGIVEDRVIRRYGPEPRKYIATVLSDDLSRLVVPSDDCTGEMSQLQVDDVRWPGGYFGFPGRSSLANELPDELRAWRKEYLPGPTELLATAFCSALAGIFLDRHSAGRRLRVTLHRVATFGTDRMLQQVCDYVGTANAAGATSAAARTFPAKNATVGLAYRCQRIVRSRVEVDPLCLNAAMQRLRLNDASRRMSSDVGFVLAIPVLAPGSGGLHRVVAVVYLDSTAKGFFIADDELRALASMTAALFRSLTKQRALERITKLPQADLDEATVAPEPLPIDASATLELVSSVGPPTLDVSFELNFDFSDFIPV